MSPGIQCAVLFPIVSLAAVAYIVYFVMSFSGVPCTSTSGRGCKI